ncbi:hypothetical protein GVN21_14590 [Caulobacter sp. SLTY]|uniref:hypothetical protein n=1 Tax=Caulobacter sp. SLTY TaxID=2683262 RepID=UPI00141296B3|nr:hypothetical protein [Caulobacter sp. SLTY]NBB16588.1 hypothetical protein [Caulobacter sp. SLTY]
MPKSKKPTSRSPDIPQRNKIRGALGAALSRTSGPSRPRIERYRISLRQALLDARPALPSIYRSEFFGWLDRVLLGNEAARSALTFGLSPHPMEGPRIAFPSELQWLDYRIRPYFDDLRGFRQAALALNDAFWRHDKSICFSVLEDIERRFGTSIWYIETRIAIEQYFNGLEAQKNYLSTIKDEYPKGLPAYIAHFASIRNEVRSTMRLFRDDASIRIASSNAEDSIKTYFKYKIADVFECTDIDISRIISTEQGQSIIDIYETAVSLFQAIINAGKSERYAEAILRATQNWEGIGDFRLDKIRIALGGEPLGKVGVKTNLAGRGIFSATTRLDVATAIKNLCDDPGDIWAGVGVLFAEASATGDTESLPGPWQSVLDHMRSVIMRDDDFEASVGALEKFSRNFRTLSTGAALSDFVSAITGAKDSPQVGLGSAALNAPQFGLPDLALAGDPLPQALTVVQAASDPAEFGVWFGRDVDRPDGSRTIPASYFRAERLFRQGRPSDALTLLAPIRLQELDGSLRSLIGHLRIGLSLNEGEIDSALRDIATEAAHRPGARSLLPAVEAVGARGWKELAALSDRLTLAICLDIVWRNTGDDLRATHLRFAFEDYLSNEQVTRPSELAVRPDELEKTIYFLRYICVPPIIDLAGIFEDSAGVIEERSSILKLLREIDPLHDDEYAEEASFIFTRRAIQEGLNIVDSSRVHVDTTAISRWAERRYAESFDRYKALVSAGIGVAEDFDEMLRSALRSTDRPTDYFKVPDNEADALLLDIVTSLRSEFLSNQEHGLHFYVGKRIRHGTVTGHLRGSLETAHLITQRVTDGGGYRSNEYWLDRLTFESTDCRERCDKLFREFAERYDALVEDLKNNKLHVQSRERAGGLFNFQVTPLSYHVIRSAVQTDLSFTGFLASCYSIFWGLLEPSFATVRNLIGVDLKNEAAEMFDGLQAGVRNLAIPDGQYHEFSTALRSASVDVQRQFESMAEWFRRTETEQASHLFGLEALIDISIESALKTHKGFSPDITKVITGNVRASSAVLVIISDIVFIIIDNICRRAQAGSSPKVQIVCEFDAEADVLTIDVINSVGSGLDRGIVDARLQDTRAKIASGDIRAGALRDHNSGLLKIAAITGQSERAGLTFGFYGADEFRTTVKLSMISGPSNSSAPVPINLAAT